MNTILFCLIALVFAYLVVIYGPTLYLVIRHWVDDKSYYAKYGDVINRDGTAFDDDSHLLSMKSKNGNWLPVIIAFCAIFWIVILLVVL